MFITGNIFHFTQIEKTFCLTLSQMCPKKSHNLQPLKNGIFTISQFFLEHWINLGRHRERQVRASEIMAESVQGVADKFPL